VTGLEIEDLTVTAGGRTVVERLSLRVRPGSALSVTGPAGSGRSALLDVLAGLRPPAAGRVRLGDRPLGPDLIGHAVGYAPQSSPVLHTLTAVENVALALLARGVPAADAWAAAARDLGELGLPDAVRDNLAEQLSGGQRQRVAFARAVAGGPALVVADDPASELDPDSAELILGVLRRLTAAGTVVVLATPTAAPPGPGELRVDLDG
jgi:ABC-type multidrug transport system ATPase subunit